MNLPGLNEAAVWHKQHQPIGTHISTLGHIDAAWANIEAAQTHTAAAKANKVAA